MSLTLGLNAAISGLLTHQRALDVISQNVVNVNTAGYTRKVMNPESRVLGGYGAGVQVASVTRSVDEGLLRDIRRQATQLGSLQAEQTYYPRIDDLFGQVTDETSVAHKMQSLANNFEVLSTEANRPTQQWGTVQSAVDVTSQLNQMTEQLQHLRLEADRDIEHTVMLINEQLSSVADLNNKIVRNEAIGADTGDLKDKRDTALSTLSNYLDIQYYERSDGSMLLFTGAGRVLVDSTAGTLTHAATTTTDSSLTFAGGNYNAITLNSFTEDLGEEITGGKLRALLDMRDTIIPNLQANLDELSAKMSDVVNQVHNRGTVMPSLTSTYTGTRVFAQQGDVVNASTDALPTIYFGSNSITATLTNSTGGGFGSLTFDNADTNYPYRATITAATAGSLASLTVGKTFSIAGSTNSRNDGTYTVVAVNGDQLTVEKANIRQTVQMGSGEDVAVALFDRDGNQLSQTTLTQIMQVDYSAGYASSDARGAADFEAKTGTGPWSINEISAHLQQWLRAQGSQYSNATAGLNSEGKLVINTGDTSSSLVFRDQASSTAGADAQDVSMNFDVNGDGTTDEVVKGFSNFFGLNDFFVSSHPNSITESGVLDKSFKTTAQTRTMQIYDRTGQIGNDISIPPGSTLEEIATRINNATKVSESTLLSSKTINLATAGSISIYDASGATLSVVSLAASASMSLDQIAGKITDPTKNLKAEVVADGTGYRLRVYDTRGSDLSFSFAGGTVGSSTLGSTLEMASVQHIRATVVPESSGNRLRITHTADQEVYVAAAQDAQNSSIITDLDLHHSATRAAGSIAVRTDIQASPERVSRGAMQWNADIGRYYLSSGDNTTALQLAEAMNTKTTMSTAGNIFSGSYTFAEYTASTISVVATMSAHSKDQLDYQTTLKDSLDFQYTSDSGVNLDEEISNMIVFQQAYSASAKIISAIQQMLEELVNIIR